MRAPRTFRALRHPPFRWFALAALTSDTAMWMQRIIQDWLAVKVSGGGVAVGVTTALQFLPILFVGPIAGSLADRLPRKWLLVMTGAMMATPSLLLGLIVATGAVQVWHIYLLALVMGVGSGMDTPTRMAYIRDLLDKDDFVNGIGLGAVGFHTARIIGPAVSGALIATAGIATSLFSVTAMYLLAIAAILRTRPSPAVEGEGGAAKMAKPGVADALGKLREQPGLLVVMGLACVVSSVTLNFQVTITLMATQVFKLDPAGFGRLTSMMAAGSIVGALLVARLARPSYVVVFGAAGLLGLAYCLAVGAQSPLQFAAALLPVGLLSNLYLASSSALVQIRTDRRYQGRVAGLYLSAAFALVPLGSVLIGWAADKWSPRGPLAVAGLVCIAAAALTVFALLALGVLRWRSGRFLENDAGSAPALTAG